MDRCDCGLPFPRHCSLPPLLLLLLLLLLLVLLQMLSHPIPLPLAPALALTLALTQRLLLLQAGTLVQRPPQPFA